MFEPAPLVVEAPPDSEVLTAAAERAARQWGLPVPQLIRIGANGVFACDSKVLRVGRATAPMGTALRFAERLATLGVRAARPARHDWIEEESGLSVTAWERIDFDPDGIVDWERVGAMVAVVHGIDPVGVDHPLPFCGDFPWWDFDHLLAAAAADPEAHEVLAVTVERHRWWYAQARSRPIVLCHGDVHPGNVLVAADGPVLIDWDLLCVGPRAWDHAALHPWTRRWGGEPGMYEAFATGYARPVDEDMLAALSELRLVAATLMRLRRAAEDPRHRPEADRRMRYWRGEADAPVWQAQ